MTNDQIEQTILEVADDFIGEPMTQHTISRIQVELASILPLAVTVKLYPNELDPRRLIADYKIEFDTPFEKASWDFWREQELDRELEKKFQVW